MSLLIVCQKCGRPFYDDTLLPNDALVKFICHICNAPKPAEVVVTRAMQSKDTTYEIGTETDIDKASVMSDLLNAEHLTIDLSKTICMHCGKELKSRKTGAGRDGKFLCRTCLQYRHKFERRKDGN